MADGAYSRWFRQETLTSSLRKSFDITHGTLQSYTFVYTYTMGRKCMGKHDIGKIPDVKPHSGNISKTTGAISQEEKNLLVQP